LCSLSILNLQVAWQENKGAMVLAGSYDTSVKMMGDMGFLTSLLNFPKEQINDETVELLQPYFAAPDFNYESARKASGNVAGALSCQLLFLGSLLSSSSKQSSPSVETHIRQHGGADVVMAVTGHKVKGVSAVLQACVTGLLPCASTTRWPRWWSPRLQHSAQQSLSSRCEHC
jgi:hypothetical protein